MTDESAFYNHLAKDNWGQKRMVQCKIMTQSMYCSHHKLSEFSLWGPCSKITRRKSMHAHAKIVSKSSLHEKNLVIPYK